ncbi:MAG TPA: M23 family metallopeptidase [Gemmatimonadaceae bacterium]|nr:M23 family metallopeptidase [Gemmatimonadaceae bacterium]
MKPNLIRFGLYLLVALLFAAALRLTPQLPDPDRKAAEVLTTQAAVPTWKLRFDTLGRGESLGSLLKRGGLNDAAVTRAMQAATTGASLDPRRIPAGMPVTIRSEAADSSPSEVTLQIATDRLLHLRRTGDSWAGTEERLPWTTDTIAVGGTIASNLYEAIDSSAKSDLPAGARQQLAWALADVYEYRVDMSRDLQVGDEFKVIAERMIAPTGVVRIGKVIAATFKLSGTLIDAVRFSSKSATGDYFDQNGKSMRAAFLRAPLEFRRISSVFGMREHPILGGMREHKGMDYAAAMGTPVRAIGDGVVTRASWSNGYGNLLEIRHRNGFVTRYGHLSRYQAGIHAGSRVTIGETIAYVGSTGLSTGPHLHFEVLVDGQQRDPRIALKSTGGEPVPAAERAEFTQLRDRMLASLDAPLNGVTKLAAR